MSISQLSLTDFRNLKSTTLDFHPSINLISGNNGAGKTNLLESIHVLCQACSFRTHQLKHCISHDKSSFMLFGRFNGYKVGLLKAEKKLEIKINGDPVGKRSTLVSKTPVNIVNADSFDLVIGSPEERRKYLNWCLFHVEQDYSEYWAHYRHALKQRNQLLKNRRDLKLLDYWNQYLVEPSQEIRQYRKHYTGFINKQLIELFPELLKDTHITLQYIQGWPEDIDLLQCLEGSRDKDIKAGYTNHGIHRDNLQIMANGLPAGQVLSRGQMKRLCLALIVVGLKIVREKSNKKVILLIDDLRSELDEEAQNNVYSKLIKIGLQLFVTNIKNNIPAALQRKEFKMFHVEHGMIKALKNVR